METLLAALLIFVLRIMDMSLDTIRMLFVMRGRRALAGLIGAAQAAVFIVAVSAVLTRPLNAFTVIGYAAGFGTGVVIGMIAEGRLALGYAIVRVYSPAFGKGIARRAEGRGLCRDGVCGAGQDRNDHRRQLRCGTSSNRSCTIHYRPGG